MMETLLAEGVAAADTTADTTGAMLSNPTPAIDWLIIGPVLIPLLAAAILIIFRRSAAWHPLIAISAFAGTIVCSFMLLLRVQELGPQAMTMGNWFPPFGISFAADLLGVTLTLTSSIAVFCVGLYALGEISKRERRFGFYALLMSLLVGVNGAFLTGDIFNLYVWFEVFLISSFGLIVLGGGAKQLDGAVKYCFLNLIATTLFLIATGYLYGVYGTLSMADLSTIVGAKPFEGALVIISMLYFVAFSMKAAAFPLYFWLPASYHTPKIVVSALFAGLLTKVGIYALIRTFTIILPPAGESWLMILMLYAGIATMVCGALGAVVQTDLRRLFSYLLVASIGFMLVGLSIGTEQSLAATMFYMVHSILVMTALFLLSGLVYNHRGTLDLRTLCGVNKDFPFLSFMFLILVFMASGFPPFSGFWPKLVLISESLETQAYWGTSALIFSSFLSIIALGRAYAFGFWRSQIEGDPPTENNTPLHLSGVRSLQYIPVLILIALATLVGVLPSYLFDLSTTGAQNLLNSTAYIEAVLGGAL